MTDDEVFAEYIKRGVQSEDGQFALRYGTGIKKISPIPEMSFEQATQAMENFLAAYQQLQDESITNPYNQGGQPRTGGQYE